MAESVFETRPKNVEVMATAQAEWARWVASKTDGLAAMREALDIHMAHVARMNAERPLDEYAGALIITDIEGYDLALVDAHFPAFDERLVQVFTRRGVEIILQMVNKKSPTVDQFVNGMIQ